MSGTTITNFGSSPTSTDFDTSFNNAQDDFNKNFKSAQDTFTTAQKVAVGVGVSIGVLVLIFCIGVVVFIVRRRKQRQRMLNEYKGYNVNDNTNASAKEPQGYEVVTGGDAGGKAELGGNGRQGVGEGYAMQQPQPQQSYMAPGAAVGHQELYGQGYDGAQRQYGETGNNAPIELQETGTTKAELGSGNDHVKRVEMP